MTALPDQWSFPPSVSRERRLQGLGAFPAPQMSPTAIMLSINGPKAPIPLRLFKAPSGNPQGVLLHIHGGGFVFGSCAHQDPYLEALAASADIDIVSVEYRLAPEYPFPAGLEDCEAAALWITGEGAKQHQWQKILIGGESAGANLALATMIRLRDSHKKAPFEGAILSAGFYDLNLTPSARNWGTRPLLLNTRDLELFAKHYVLRGPDKTHPEVSPLYAKLHDLPPTIVTVGTEDPLLDDSLFLAARLQATNCEVHVEIYPNGCHVFQSFDLGLAKLSGESIDTFIKDRLGPRR
ncbi:alpha/beta hydrolase [Pseudovibrio sp. SPO723]|uniref:alpha/beta hydrolase n=1 Tax=Nesiotobacter zosterae TaxID=392721 RepID=UPI0029C33805|nr:alpha/beta hydrolase [Pseudovibrio sp. SPO723]MDX5593198.1 alpha/beta hydrolase [Pseudovibrio sp. SPO723]